MNATGTTRPNAWPLAAMLIALVAPARSGAALPAWHGTAGLPDDGETTALVLARLAADERMREMEIRVRSHDGIVRLGGVVDSEANAERASALAHEIPGVWRVENVLAVRPTLAPSSYPCAPGASEVVNDHD